MTLQELVLRQFTLVYDIAAANVAGMTHADSLAQPSPGGNCANWILGHIVNVHNELMRLVGEEPVWENEQLARAGFDPITSPQEAIDWGTLTSRFFASRERCLAGIARLSDEEMAQGGIPYPFGGTCTRADLLALMAFHQTYHTGQLAVARRIAGHAGAIKGPGQEGGVTPSLPASTA